jgi:ATP-binding cassette, subfamily C (CFTR/MRP), member 1
LTNRVSVCNLDTLDNINSNSEHVNETSQSLAWGDSSKFSSKKNTLEEQERIIPTIISQDSQESKIKVPLTLKNINLQIYNGETVGIIGEVSSGKSSLLQAILNNLIFVDSGNSSDSRDTSDNSIFINGSTAYVSQVPWIQNDTIKNNILFFKQYDEIKYQQVLKICQLEQDIEMLEAGDNTEIGEKGINLSGGQKARVALARSVYADRDIYLLDDPISALDAHVGKKIIKECILKHLQGRTILLVTHALQYLKYMNRIIYLSQGQIKWTGTYKELKDAEFFKELSHKLHQDEKPEEQPAETIEEKLEPKKIVKQSEIKRITKEEEQEVGEVKLSVYLKYFEYMGGKLFGIMIVFIMLLWQVNKAGSDYWLAYWSQKQNQESRDKWIFFSIYSSLGLGSTIFIFFRIFLLCRGTIRLGMKLHKDMIVKLIKAPINLFHDTIPRGQIYNRLSKDLYNVVILMFYFGGFLVCFFSAIGAIVICSIYEPISLVFVPIFGIFGYLLTSFYLRGSRDLSRLEGVSRSPLLNTLSETIAGSISIRAYKFEQEYLNKFYSKVNDLFKVEIFINGSSNWFGMNMDFVSLTFITFITVIIIIYEKEFTPQSVGLMLTYTFTLKDNLFDLFKLAADFENMMVSMERCLQYTRIEEEKEFEMVNDRELKMQNWPKEGKIEIVNYSVKYRPNTEVILKNLNLLINPKEKIGVVGRTGSGKSTMCLSLFRILEPLNGTIKIDDVDITGVGLNLLRQKLTIIPQDPSLMKGTLKYNIDPFNKYPDNEILNVLSMIGFNSIMKNEQGLDRMISEAGENLSVGEKQLICIARAILRVN